MQCARLHLEASGVEVVVTREPGGTELAESIRGLFLGHVMSAHTEALLAFAARRDHLERVIWPALARGAWVLCDRYVDSTFAYQGGGRGLDTRIIEALAEWSIGDFEPNATFLFDVSAAAAKGRLSGRDSLDRIEAEAAEFHIRVRDAFLARSVEWAHRFSVFNAEQEENFVRTEMLNELNLLLDRWQTRCNSGDFS